MMNGNNEMLFDIPIMMFKNTSEWEEWLRRNYTDSIGIWMKIAKKNSDIVSIDYAEALDVCLCYGWIDGQRRGYDEQYFLQKYTQRRKTSLWSKVNIGKVEALIASGRMQTPGLQAIEAAKIDGRWDAAYDSQSTAVESEDLLMALNKNKKAKEFYETLTRAEKYAVLWRLMTAKTAKTRASRLEKMIASLELGHKI